MDKVKAVEDIAFIKKVIAENRKVSYPNGIYYIIWGIAVFFGSLGNYFLISNELFRYLLWMWGGIIGSGWVFTIIASRHEDKKCNYSSFTGRLYGMIWLAAGICMTIIGFAAPFSSTMDGMAICPVIGMIMGFAHFISGLLNDFKWQQLTGVLWWAGSIVLFFWVAVENFILFAIMMLFLQVLPGYILKNYQREQD